MTGKRSIEPRTIELLDVGPRDGLQNESVTVSTQNKLELINRLITCGVRRMEVASFVNPKRVPQMADAEDVIKGLPDNPAMTYIGLVLNGRGLERASSTRNDGRGIDEVGFVALTSDTFGQKNQGQTSAESTTLAADLIQQAKTYGLRAQVTISAAFGCPFEGDINPDRVVEIAKRLAETEPVEIALADTIGVAVPSAVSDIFGRVKDAVGDIPLRGHFHNTRNTAVANAWAAYQAGASTIDASIGGLGGCPFAPAATGNVATEDVAYMFKRSHVETSLDIEGLIETAGWIGGVLGRDLPGMVARAGDFPPTATKL